MNDESPPKRVTRARTAAKDTAPPTLKTAKIATASTKAKVTRSTSTVKRKTRSDDVTEDELQAEAEEIIEPEPKPKPATRGRPKKAAEPDTKMDEPPVRATRQRKPVEQPTTEPVATTRATRGRVAKKVDVPEQDTIAFEEPPKRAPRTRATTVTKAAPKKMVKFEEPDKENIIPVDATKGKAKAAESATGLRAKPVRKAAIPARATRGRAKPTVEEERRSSPLSPKKATQVGATRETASEDELASTEKTPMKPLSKSPLKPPGSVFTGPKKLDFTTTITAHKAMSSSTQDLKGSIIASPARRPPQSPFKDSMKTSPQRTGMTGSMLQSPFKLSLPTQNVPAANSPLKASLLQSPARRPQSPTKVTETGSPTRSNATFAVTPKTSKFKISRFATPRTLSKSVSRPRLVLPPSTNEPTSEASPSVPNESTNDALSVEPSLEFSGRLSSIMPREVDPAFQDNVVEEHVMLPDVDLDQAQELQNNVDGDAMAVDELQEIAPDEIDTIVVEQEVGTTTPPQSLQNSTGFSEAFALRQLDESPFHDSESDSEDELASDSARYSLSPLTAFKPSSYDFASSPSTPMPFSLAPKTPQTATQRSERRDKIGFTPLARQLSDWMAASPIKSDAGTSCSGQSPQAATFSEAIENDIAAATQASPAKSTFFDDEMSVRDELASAPELPEMELDILEENFGLAEADEEDLALAFEADEMSLLEPDQIVPPPYGGMFSPLDPSNSEDPVVSEITPSEASQEYGDENEMPIDPALLELPQVTEPAQPELATPRRVLSERVCHTVSKVPLKPAAEHTPFRSSPLKRSASISRLPSQRPTSTLTRKNTVISYSPTKSAARVRNTEDKQGVLMQDACATPLKSNDAGWSTMGTPARTPRRDLNTRLLNGAVVFVDVHTSEGADASALFTELLTQMGARCVKSWNWNGSAESGSKVGITHLVFKDGGKRALEKAKGTNGVVSCVGVGWVLDCERENKWLNEADYAVDTTQVPRGGHRRRKSMEPRALANLNGTLIHSASTPGRNAQMSPSKEFLNFDTPVTNKSRRRESVQWMRSPANSSPEDNDQTLMLSPVPTTPTPETISAYGEDGLYGDETPGAQSPYYFHNEKLVQKTAPPGRRFVDSEQVGGSRVSMGTGFLNEKKDESVMMRLMAARRKSLQWAPKVGSPLARGHLF